MRDLFEGGCLVRLRRFVRETSSDSLDKWLCKPEALLTRTRITEEKGDGRVRT